MDTHQLVLCTCPNEETAVAIANHLVDAGLAACVNIVPGITSIYRWEGQRESSREWLLIIKTHAKVYKALESAVLEQHPYELPELIAVPIGKGLPDYLKWIDDGLGLTR